MDIIYTDSNSSARKSSMDITKIPKEEMAVVINEFSEGNQELENCLITINNQGLHTIGCCKGSHFTARIDKNKIEFITFNPSSYIGFKKGEDWGSYLSSDLINDKDVLLSDTSIHYLGESPDDFFKRLNNAFLTGKKNNKEEFDAKRETSSNELYSALERKSYESGLRRNELNENQVKELMKLYDERYQVFKKCGETQGIQQKLYISKLFQIDRKFTNLVEKYYKKVKQENVQGNIGLIYDEKTELFYPYIKIESVKNKKIDYLDENNLKEIFNYTYN